MANVLHSAASGIHPGAHFSGSAPTPSQDHVLWVDTSSGPPYALKVWNAGATSWQAVGTGGSAGTITTASAQLGSNVSMTNANTQYDILSFSLGSGTWLVWYTGTYQGIVQSFSVKVWDGTTVFASQESMQAYGGSAFPGGIAIATPPIVLSSTTTVKATALSQGAGGVALAAMQHGGAGNNAHTILGLKVA